MNSKYVLFNLIEAKEELDSIIKKIKKNEKCDYGEFVVYMSHLYHHLNTAWNSRDSTEEESIECSDANFNKWRKFPSNEELLLMD